jgi:hypothetical protein
VCPEHVYGLTLGPVTNTTGELLICALARKPAGRDLAAAWAPPSGLSARLAEVYGLTLGSVVASVPAYGMAASLILASARFPYAVSLRRRFAL